MITKAYRPRTYEECQAWLRQHRDWTVSRLPHFEQRGEQLYFLISRRATLNMDTGLQHTFAAAGKGRNVGQILALSDDDAKPLARLWLACVVQPMPPVATYSGDRVCVIEPHADDAALSLGGHMWLDRDNINKRIVTIFARSAMTSYFAVGRPFGDVKSVTALRTLESQMCSRYLGAQFSCLNLAEASCRWMGQHTALSVENLSSQLRDLDGYVRTYPPRELVEQVAQAIEEHLRPFEFDRLCFPLGVCQHADHRLVRDAMLLLIDRYWDQWSGKQLFLYEEVPYGVLYPGGADKVVAILESDGVRLEPTEVDITSCMTEKLDAVSLYASQFKQQMICKNVIQQARQSASVSGHFAERIWQLQRPPHHPARPLLTLRYTSTNRFYAQIDRLEEDRHRTGVLGLLCVNGPGAWDRQMTYLLNRFPNARFDVLALAEAANPMKEFSHDRCSIRFFDRRRPLVAVFRLMIWALRHARLKLIFVPPRVRCFFPWIRAILFFRPMMYFDNLSDFTDAMRLREHNDP